MVGPGPLPDATVVYTDPMQVPVTAGELTWVDVAPGMWCSAYGGFLLMTDGKGTKATYCGQAYSRGFFADFPSVLRHGLD